MSEQIFKSIFDRATESGGRRSLETLVATTRINAEKAKMKAGKKKGQRCRAQVANCQEFVIIGCSGREDVEACEQGSLPCCDPLSTCDATSMLECFFSFL